MNEIIRYEDIYAGQSYELERTITQKLVDDFANLSGDFNPVHLDQVFCQKIGLAGPIAHGMLTLSLVSAFIGMYLPGHGSVIMGQANDYFLPVQIGDTVKIVGKVVDKQLGGALNLKIVTIKYSIKNQKNQTVMRGTVRVNLK
jgi:acyl dehydratase